MWLFYILTSLLASGVAIKLIHPLMVKGYSRADRRLAGGITVFLPLAALGLYLVLGRPDLPGAPRIFADLGALHMQHYALLAKKPAESLVADNPDVLGALMSLGEINYQLKHYPDALKFYARAVETARAQDDVRLRVIVEVLGTVQVDANGGHVGDDAKKTFEYALSLFPGSPGARHFLALHKAQNGGEEEAIAEWRTLLNDGYPDVWWKKRVRKALAEAQGAVRQKQGR